MNQGIHTRCVHDRAREILCNLRPDARVVAMTRDERAREAVGTLRIRSFVFDCPPSFARADVMDVLIGFGLNESDSIDAPQEIRNAIIERFRGAPRFWELQQSLSSIAGHELREALEQVRGIMNELTDEAVAAA